MKISTRIYLSCTSVILLMAASVGIVVWSVINISQDLNNLDFARDQVLRAKDIIWLDEVLTQSTRNYIFTGDETWKIRYDDFGVRLDNVISTAIENADTEEVKGIFRRQDQANLVLVGFELQAHELVKNNETEEALILLDSVEYKEWKEIYADTIDEYLDNSELGLNAITQKLDRSESFSRKGVILAVILTIVSLLITIISGISTGKFIAYNTEKLSDAADQISRGDFSVRLNEDTRSEFSELAASLNRLANSAGNITNTNKSKAKKSPVNQ